ncbi:conserved Plasmodium membrane protein, unknown function [Plasmodium sp. gorilla clade G2]|uniref:conserved Plasmodium membrane protein, unknown function n=1 Tax=Plasmodium sp. gorilla clade G2 TaxID=880535 RepID=UPI000D228C39|nr:conserved Plasmodium membrane protein, unknown function [Plasmodium sp. gorilla clade G2]SOV18289.1 conserved Plasmodium membrane protein, unknown function [Plasmodium sp. gorilla clade G2]
MKETCYIVPGELGLLIQVFMGFISLSILFTKYIFERPKRLFVIFLKDLIIISCGSITLHIINICLCIVLFRYDILLYMYNIHIDECSIYFIHTIIDITFGLYLQYKIFALYKFIKVRNKYFQNFSISHIYKPVDALSHYASFLNSINNSEDDNIMGTSKELTNIRNNIYKDKNDNVFFKEYNNSNTKKREDIYINYFHEYHNYEEEVTLKANIHRQEKKNIKQKSMNDFHFYKNIGEKYEDLNFLASIFLWISVILTTKIITFIFFLLLFPLFNFFVIYTIDFINDTKVKLFVVMIIFPFFFNFIMYFFIDTMMQRKHKYKKLHNDNSF